MFFTIGGSVIAGKKMKDAKTNIANVIIITVFFKVVSLVVLQVSIEAFVKLEN